VEAARAADYERFRLEQNAAKEYIHASQQAATDREANLRVELEQEQRARNEPTQNVNNDPAGQVVDPAILNAMQNVQARKRRALDAIDGQSSGDVQGADGYLPVSAYVEFQKGDGDLSTIDGVFEVEDSLQNMSVNSALLG
jgi:hypothetical protein